MTTLTERPNADVQTTDRQALLEQLEELEHQHRPRAHDLARQSKAADAMVAVLAGRLRAARQERALADRRLAEASRTYRRACSDLTRRLAETAAPDIEMAISELDQRHRAIAQHIFDGQMDADRGRGVLQNIFRACGQLEEIKIQPLDRRRLSRLSATGEECGA